MDKVGKKAERTRWRKIRAAKAVEEEQDENGEVDEGQESEVDYAEP